MGYPFFCNILCYHDNSLIINLIFQAVPSSLCTLSYVCIFHWLPPAMNSRSFPWTKSAEMQTYGKCPKLAQNVYQRALKNLEIWQWDGPHGSCRSAPPSQSVSVKIGIEIGPQFTLMSNIFPKQTFQKVRLLFINGVACSCNSDIYLMGWLQDRMTWFQSNMNCSKMHQLYIATTAQPIQKTNENHRFSRFEEIDIV